MQNTNRPQGKWILVGKTESRSNILKCTNCNRIRRGRPYSPFCPDCGAEMTKGECNDKEWIPPEEQYHQITMDEYLESLANGE